MDILDEEAGAEPIHSPAVNRDDLLDDIRERVQRIAGLVEGAHIAERCFSDIGHSALATVDPEDYLNAVCGSIDTARDELAKLQKLLNGKPEGGGA